jgi:DNA replication protein DnaC
MIDDKWIETAQKHFYEYGEKPYIKNDAHSGKSIRINNDLKESLVELLIHDNKVTLDKKGNKWGKQGHLKLNPVIWYRIYYTEFGEKYPIVFGVHIGKSGLKIAIQIYENALKDEALCDILGDILSTVIESKGPQQLIIQVKNNINNKCRGFSSPNILTIDEFKYWFFIILNIYKIIVKNINQEIFNNLVYLYDKNNSSIIDKNIYLNIKNAKESVGVKDNFEEFLKMMGNSAEVKKAIDIIKQNGVTLKSDNLTESIKYIKDKLITTDKTDYEKLYLANIFLNIIDKFWKTNNEIIFKKIAAENNNNLKLMYQLMYLFLFGKPTHQTNNAKLFDTLIKRSKNIIFYGAPGTGKTYTAEENIKRIIDENQNENCDVSKRFYKVQFHPSYAYEDFMEGLKPILVENQINCVFRFKAATNSRRMLPPIPF